MLDIEQFAISFQKLVEIVERVDIQKEVDVDVFVKGNLAMADSKAIADADALGRDTVTQTLTTATTTTTVVQGVGSSSDSDAIAQSLSAAGPVKDWHLYLSGVRESTGAGSGFKPLPVITDWPRLYRTVT
jgi:hypothetical protein